MARGRKPGFVMSKPPPKFYVYQFVKDGVVIYVGKGCGRRLEHQTRRFGFQGEIVKYFRSETEAYAFEVKLIKRLNPSLNMNKGGGGQRSSRRVVRRPRWLLEIEAVGTRVFAARGLLKFDLSGHVSASQLATISQIAAIG